MLQQLQKDEAEIKSRQEQLDAEMKEIKSTKAELGLSALGPIS